MFYKIVSLFIILAFMSMFVHTDLFGLAGTASSTLILGFMLLSAYCIGFLLEKFGLPRITGYIFAGIVLGPYFLKYFNKDAVTDLGFINSLALSFIAFCAGGELKLSNIRNRLKSILFLIFGITSVVFIGVTLSVFSISGYIAFMSQYSLSTRLAISAIFGVIAVARSPSSAIAIISETKAKGDYTDTVLSVTVVMDVVIIIFFAFVVSACQVLISAGDTIAASFILYLLLEIVIAFVSGFFLGKAIIYLIEKVHVEFPVVIAAMGFIVIKFCHLLGSYFQEVHDIGINLEPLLICMAAGFTVQNISKHGATFLDRMDRVSLPIYISFFAITGASINVEVLKAGWFLGLLIVCSRTLMLFIGSFFSGKLSGDRPVIYKNTWLGFITQAGVSLGLLTEVVRRFPEIGMPIQSILIASISLNQVIGPVAFKYGLNKVGETNVKNRG